MINFDELVAVIKSENWHYEFGYSLTSDRSRQSRLHGVVSKVRNTGSDYAGIGHELALVPVAAWTKYPRTRAWLIWQLAQNSPNAYPVVQQIDVQYRAAPFDSTGYGRPINRASTGVNNQSDGFEWPLVITYTLVDGASPHHFVPVRTARSCTEVTSQGHVCPPLFTVKGNASAAGAIPDGPWSKNVKRSGRQIVIYDEPGLKDQAKATYGHYVRNHPVRFCAIFAMTLRAAAADARLDNPAMLGDVTQFTRGTDLAGSKKAFGMAMEKAATGSMTAEWSDNGLNWVAYTDAIPIAAPPDSSPFPSAAALHKQQMKSAYI